MSQANPVADNSSERQRIRRFSDLMRGLFFLAATASLIIVMSMFIFVWQPIWEEGFRDFHTISQAIDNLNETAKPASDTVPLMLGEMRQMNQNLLVMQKSIHTMQGSVHELEKITPELVHMSNTVQRMDYSITEQMEDMTKVLRRMNYLLDEMEERLSPAGMMPFNW